MRAAKFYEMICRMLRTLLGLLAAALALFAQDYRGRLQGFVTDPSGAAIPQASVTLTNTNTKKMSIYYERTSSGSNG